MNFEVNYVDEHVVAATLFLNPFMDSDLWYQSQVDLRERLKREHPGKDIQIGIIDSV